MHLTIQVAARLYPSNTVNHHSLIPPPQWNTFSQKKIPRKGALKEIALQRGKGLESITEDHISSIYLQGPHSLWAAIR